MTLLGNLIKQGIRIRESLDQDYTPPVELQKTEFRKLIIASRNTQFGKAYNFSGILQSLKKHNAKVFYQDFKAQVPVHDYTSMYEKWWYKCLQGEKDVTWPGAIKYFALSSGTSGASSKHIPVSLEMVKAIQKTSVRQILSLSRYEGLPSSVFEGGTLMGKKDWEDKLDQMTIKAKDWNITIIAGVPAWITILLEKIIKHYDLNNIHEIWPNFEIYVHGGVAFEPYKKGFQRLLGRDINYIETYLASEGFIAFQANQGVDSMRLVLNNGIFYEFIPFTEENFDEEGNMVADPHTLMVDEVEENIEYAVLISTCSGAWRYLIGDTIKFVSKADSEIVITGRTKHFLSLCGEHLSVDNMNRALLEVSNDMGFDLKEFTVLGVKHGSLFGHEWYVGTDNPDIDEASAKEKLDSRLKELNDDYKVERIAALKDISVKILPNDVFIEFMERNGKVGGQNKFPRVLKGDKQQAWLEYLGEKGLK